ncbi:MAG: L-glutamate gamma-semialdehyde dehydrogenase [Blastocatellia bacterium]|nr:L-glutamate gamma-semialdehyde dehydrogenase [Blastocatellia bacterium]MBL8195891.1 L-glutamate gamma-semialdehyde dehydrogenase [Blastocatellia bacterium]MBN8722495.1 L-glutamate gamma-semialdehyde dehydrogenase [Acidobacteriota bacterium]
MQLPPFVNETYLDFTDERTIEKFQKALDYVKSELGKTYPCVVDGKKVETGDLLTSVNPSEKIEIIGKVHKADQALANRAIEAANKAFDSWKRVPAEDRARYVFKAAAEMRRRKDEFSAWMVYEVGKSWAEADADTAEAIDFMDFYAREAIRYSQPQQLTPSPLPSEFNEMFYIPLGVGVVIPPWNFPLAIMVGMTMAAVVAGNTVVLKPSSDTPIIGAKFMELLESVSLPAGVVNFLPGSGGKIGDLLVSHPKTRFISFTGSREVGLHINELASKTSPGQIWIKRVVAEMGGKDTIVVDSSADLEDAASGIVAAAFGFSGQKCSACSRAVIVEDVYDQVLEKVAAKTKALKVGPTVDLNNFMGPVASQSAFDSIMEYIEIGKTEGTVVAGGEAMPEAGDGYFIKPTVIAGVDPQARISQEEIFGPVLALMKADNFDHALDIANNTEYGLTGAVYSSNRQHLERARRDFHVGNLYINRKCTGALVDVHPFGGFNMSGTDSKAGGRDYLMLFLQAKTVAEKF